MYWVLMGLFFVGQNFASVANSRARNGDNLWIHGITNLIANGMYIVSFYFISSKFVENMLKGGNISETIGFILFFCSCQLFGGLLSHHIMLNYIEREK